MKCTVLLLEVDPKSFKVALRKLRKRIGGQVPVCKKVLRGLCFSIAIGTLESRGRAWGHIYSPRKPLKNACSEVSSGAHLTLHNMYNTR